MTSKVKGKKGFTLIELLIVVVIIGILAAIAIPRFGETRERAYYSTLQSDLDQLQTAQEMYYQDNDYQYAADFTDLTGGADGTEGSYYTPSGDVNVDASELNGGDTWSAELEHNSGEDVTCAFAQTDGDTDIADYVDDPGVIVCSNEAD